MPRRPPPHRRGEPRTPGSGRKAGTPNKRTIQMRELMNSLCDDIHYQARLRSDFRRRRVHPTIEALVWGHVIGKPAERVRLCADVTMNQTLQKEVELFGRLTVEEMAEIAAQSQALVDKAMARAKRLTPGPASAGRSPAEDGGTSEACGPNDRGPDVARAGARERPLYRECAEVSAPPAGEPTPPAAAVHDEATCELAEPRPSGGGS